MRYTECRMAPLAMEMVRDIDEDTVDFQPNYDGRSQEPAVLPARFPNLLVNGSAGIAVGMATNIPPHNLREVAEGAQWALEHPDATREELLEALLERIKGPDFPNGALIVGRQGIEQAYRTGRGSITQRAVVEIDEDAKGRTCLVDHRAALQGQPRQPGAEDRRARRLRQGPGHRRRPRRHLGPHRPAPGRRAQARRRRPGRAQQPAQAHRAADQLQRQHARAGRRRAAHADARPVHQHWVDPPDRGHPAAHPRSGSREAEEQAHILRGLVKALDALDEVIALIRRSPDVDEARARPDGAARHRRDPGQRDPRHAAAPAGRAGAPEDHRRPAPSSSARSPTSRTSSPTRARQRQIVSEELAEIVEKYGDDRRTQIIAADGDLSMEDLIPDEDLVVTITRGGYAKRTRADQYRTQKRGGKGVRGATLRGDDVVEHFIATTNHHWLLFFTTAGRVYRTKAYNLPEASRDAKGGHVAGLLSFQPDENDRPGAGDPRLRAGAVPRARHPQRPGQEDPAGRLQQPAPGRRHRDQLPRGRRRADRRRAGQRRRRHPAGLAQGSVDPVPRRRHASCGRWAGRLRRHRA